MNREMESRFIQARKDYIAVQFSNLNPMQRESVMMTEGPLLLLAGAGSGKTTVLIHRIANLIRFGCASDSEEVPGWIKEEDVLFLEQQVKQTTDADRADALCALRPVAPWSIIAITFTNKAANELKARLGKMLGGNADDIWAMTFHSACCRILRRNIDRLGYNSSFTIYDTADSMKVISDILGEMDLSTTSFPPRSILSAISREKDKMVSPEQLAEWAEEHHDVQMMPIAKVYMQYQKRLRDSNALDFDDIILLTVKLFQKCPDVLRYYQEKFRYVLVDEYQDTNHVQYLLTSLLAAKSQNICVVGDDDQSIYRFRGATIANILNFEKQYAGARVIRLEQNYRSSQAILNAANTVIANNLRRKGKRLWTSNHAGKPITVYEAADETAEAKFIADRILSEVKDRKFSQFAVLYRTNIQSNTLEYVFQRSGVPYKIIGGTRFFDRAEVKDMLAYLCLINNRGDDLRFRRIVNVPARGIGDKSVEYLQRIADAEKCSLYQMAYQCGSYGGFERVEKKFNAFTQLIEGLSDLLEQGMSLPDFYDAVMERTGYADMLRAKDTPENASKLEHIQELKSNIAAYVENADEPTLGGFLEEIALYTDQDQYSEEDEVVSMMTIHASKGLEFPHVFLSGVEEGNFPSARSIGEPDQIEEERRLCYVAITRAKETLTISHCAMRMVYGKTNRFAKSRFIKELPQNELNIIRDETRTSSPWMTESRSDFRPRSVSLSGELKRPAPTAAAFLELNKGDMIQHKAFGRGMVLSVMKMGGDALLEIAFDEIGTKRLMAKTASAHMKKLS